MEKTTHSSNELSPKIKTLLQIIVLLVIILFIFGSFGNSKNNKPYTSNDMVIKNTAIKLARDCSAKNYSGKNNFYEEKEKCYKNSFKKLIDSYNFSFAEQTLYALQDIDENTKSCHILSHYISRMAVKKNPSEWLSLLDNVNVNSCGSGFLHGVLEAHLGDDPNVVFNGELSNKICNRGEDDYRKRMCTHFMGHFFLVNSDDNVEDAVPKCDKVTDELKFDCLIGIFMEHNQKIALVDHNLAPPPSYTPEYANELEKVCYKYKGAQSRACSNEMAEVYAKTYGYDSKIIYNKCYNKMSTDIDAQTCYLKGVVILATYPYEVSKEKITSICSYYSDEKRYKLCTTNLLSSLMYYSPKFTSRGVLLCSNIEKYKEWCFDELGKLLSQFVKDPNSRLDFCISAEDRYKNLCANIKQ